uniref:ATPase AAA-2 domain protein n=1 Tax=Leptospirillum ferrodiazotrophum TaxID=412449 RepID=C6HYE9_9BACT|nr:MAG: ATPase AAA-2 domain protein [Leptospirillum ferrodiazotrophum]
MIIADLKPLFRRMSPILTRAVEQGAGLCLSRSHYEITPEHVVISLLDHPDSDVMKILAAEGIDGGSVRREMSNALDDLRSGNGGRPVFSPLLIEVLQDAHLIASINRNEPHTRSGVFLQAFVNRLSAYSSGRPSKSLERIGKERLKDQFDTLASGSAEAIGGGQESQEGPSEEGTAIGRFCEDFTEKARKGKIDPVFGRDAEVRQIIDILSRRRKNNPICVGDPGVGKTAVVESLALRIVEGDVPESLSKVRLLGLDMGALEAGAGVKGEFENRLKGVINEIKASSVPVILFIDEAHTLIGAGGAQGGGDAANLLKPALARGELRTIAATTWAEYKKYFEKDAALARRFQPVKLDEPSVETAILILRGLKAHYEAVHHVTIRDDALVAAATLSDRYLTGRKLPDKAVDLLDTSAARIRISQSSKPEKIEGLERRIQALEREKNGLVRDQTFGQDIPAERLDAIGRELGTLEQELSRQRERWEKEKTAVAELLAHREDPRREGPDRESWMKELRTKEAAVRKIQEDHPMIHFEVDPETVARVVSNWTGIPLGKLLREQAQTVMRLQETLGERVLGQEPALARVGEIIRNSRAGFKAPNQPVGIFLLVGPSGVGKTETALAVADILFGDEKATVTLNMSEFQEKHQASRLIGSPPGYVGYGEGGLLTEAVRQRPYSVVLLDEVEKAHPDILNMFYQVFDKGVLSDGEGKEIDFSNTVIFLTSNLASEKLSAYALEHPEASYEDLVTLIRPDLSRHFKPALLARMTIVPYLPLRGEALGRIVRLKTKRLSRSFVQNNGVEIVFEDSLIDHVALQCETSEAGARNIDYLLQSRILPEISRELIGRLVEGTLDGPVRVGIAPDGTTVIGTGATEAPENPGSEKPKPIRKNKRKDL